MTLIDELGALARKFAKQADKLDEAWLAHADKRAVQAGAACDEAHAYRHTAKQLRGLARDMADWNN